MFQSTYTSWIKKILQHITFEINQIFFSEITGSILDYPVLHEKCHANFYYFPPSFRISQYLLHKHYLKSNHRNLLPTYKSTLSHQVLSHMFQDFVKCCIKNWVHLDLLPDNVLFGGLPFQKYSYLQRESNFINLGVDIVFVLGTSNNFLINFLKKCIHKPIPFVNKL